MVVGVHIGAHKVQLAQHHGEGAQQGHRYVREGQVISLRVDDLRKQMQT